jgi:hypothetical protein
MKNPFGQLFFCEDECDLKEAAPEKKCGTSTCLKCMLCSRPGDNWRVFDARVCDEYVKVDKPLRDLKAAHTKATKKPPMKKVYPNLVDVDSPDWEAFRDAFEEIVKANGGTFHQCSFACLDVRRIDLNGH